MSFAGDLYLLEASFKGKELFFFFASVLFASVFLHLLHLVLFSVVLLLCCYCAIIALCQVIR